MSQKNKSSEKTIYVITLLLLLVAQGAFFLKNKEFFYFFGRLTGQKDFQFFKDLGLYGLEFKDFQNLQHEPVLAAIIIIFVCLDVFLLSKVLKVSKK